MVLSKMTPRLMGKCTLTPRTSTRTSRSSPGADAGLVAVSVIGSPLHRVVAAQGPPGGPLGPRGDARADRDRLRGPGGEGAGVVPGEVVRDRPRDGREPLAARCVEPGDR